MFTLGEDALLQTLILTEESCTGNQLPNEALTGFCQKIASQFKRHPLFLVKRILELRSSAAKRDQKMSFWSVEECNLLLAVTEGIQEPRWIEVAEHFPGKSSIEVRRKFYTLRQEGVKKGKWTREEDIRVLVGQKTFANEWVRIATLFNLGKGNTRTDV